MFSFEQFCLEFFLVLETAQTVHGLVGGGGVEGGGQAEYRVQSTEYRVQSTEYRVQSTEYLSDSVT